MTHQTAILGPFLARMGLTFAVWLFMVARRIPFIRGLGDVDLFVFRVLHSAIHCTFNHVMARFTVYFVASVALWFMLLRAALGQFGA